MLRGGVGGRVREPLEGGGRCDVDDRPAPAERHRGEERGHHAARSVQVHREHPGEEAVVGSIEGRALGGARGVDEDVDLAGESLRRADDAPHRGGIRHVAGDRKGGLAAQRAVDLAGGALERFRRSRDDADLRTGGGEGACDGPSYPAAPPRHEGRAGGADPGPGLSGGHGVRSPPELVQV